MCLCINFWILTIGGKTRNFVYCIMFNGVRIIPPYITSIQFGKEEENTCLNCWGSTQMGRVEKDKDSIISQGPHSILNDHLLYSMMISIKCMHTCRILFMGTSLGHAHYNLHI
jgi:hypothetical protein